MTNDFDNISSPFTPEEINKAEYGVIPVRQDITVLPADNPKELRLGLVIYENLPGWGELGDEVANMNTGQIYSSKGWHDLDWTIYRTAVHRRRPKIEAMQRHEIEKIIQELRTHPEDCLFVESYFFIKDLGKMNCYEEYKTDQKYLNLFSDLMSNIGRNEPMCAFGNPTSNLFLFPFNENRNSFKCKLHMLEKALAFLTEKDPEEHLGWHLHLEKKTLDKQTVNCYNVIKDEIETVWNKVFQWFAVYHSFPTAKQLRNLNKGNDVKSSQEKFANELENGENMPEQWLKLRKKRSYGTVVINDYATSKINLNKDEQ